MRAQLLVRVLAAVIVAAACGGANPPAPAEEAAKTELQMDMTPSGSTTTILTSAQPIADFLSKEIGVPVKARVPLSYAAVVEDFSSKNADIGWSGAVGYVAARNKAGAEAVTVSQRCLPPTVFPSEPQGKSPNPDTTLCKPQGPYPSIIFCGSGVAYSGSRDDPSALSQLKGKKFAFGDPLSGSSSIWPRYYLKQAGVNPDSDFAKVTSLSSQTAVAVAVGNGTVDCGATFGDARVGSAQRTVPDILTKTKVVFVSPLMVPGDPQFLRKGLNSAQKAKVKAAMAKLGTEPTMKKPLLDLYGINALGTANDRDYDVIQKYADTVKPGLLGEVLASPSPAASPSK
ncbi:MAG TPA: phosphate/phosphite/phosphonate ABC transporter substrate-binding protein [Candidatus Acidoferrales bacterium]|nr:phosphate/phosphite/phosphonate ABC transporter substrate-binding protein [Candidatus Acidoferrales bacterium]